MAVVDKLFSIATVLQRGIDLYPELTRRWTNLQDYLQQFAADHTHSGGPDGAFITGGFDQQTSSRTFTNTTFRDLNGLTGGGGSIAAVRVSLKSAVDHNILVAISARISNDTAGSSTRVGFKIVTATTLTANENRSLTYESGSNNDLIRAGWVGAFAVNAGTNAVELQASVSANTGTIDDTRLTVIPFS